MRVLVTGSEGYIGTVLTPYLIARGHDVVGLDTGFHRVGWLWPVHALHHAVDRLHVGKASRTHLLDMLGRSLGTYAPLVALGVPPDVLVWYPAAVTILGPIAHANVDVRRQSRYGAAVPHAAGARPTQPSPHIASVHAVTSTAR